jgi:hypothetical protein
MLQPISVAALDINCIVSCLHDILDMWLRCQQGWLYLKPIFGSDDIQQQMPDKYMLHSTVSAGHT